MNGIPHGKLTGEPGMEASTPPPKPSYDGYAATPCWSDEAKVTINADGLLLEPLFEQDAAAYADIREIALEDYVVQIRTNSGEFAVSRMGQQAEWFYRELCAAYQKKVLAVFGIAGSPDFETTGQYALTENGQTAQGKAQIQVFPDCLCLLPATDCGRRLPFAFVNGFKREGFVLSLSLATDEVCVLSKAGYDTTMLEKQIEGHIRAVRENASKLIGELDPSLSFSQISAAARFFREPLAVPLKTLYAAAPPLAAALEQKVKNSKMGAAYPSLLELCDDEKLCVGIRAVPPEEVEAVKTALLDKRNETAAEDAPPAELTSEQEDTLKWILWVAVPSKDQRAAIVEFAFPNEDAATYLFRIDGGWEAFLPILNRALEATGLRRECFLLTEEELRQKKQANARMLVSRTPALKALRGCFAGRVIHRSGDGWKAGLQKKLARISAETAAPEYDAHPKFCHNCGAQLADGIRFCGTCGAKIR